MARLKSAPRRRRSPLRPEAAGGEDRLSSLPDALLRRVLSCLDTRTALSTAVLSRRWARLVRDLPTLRFSVADVLPPRYFRALDRRRRARDIDGKLLRYIKRCDRRAMRAFLDGVAGILDAPPSGGARRRRANALYLEFFRTYDGAGIIDRMIETAVGDWATGVSNTSTSSSSGRRRVTPRCPRTSSRTTSSTTSATARASAA